MDREAIVYVSEEKQTIGSVGGFLRFIIGGPRQRRRTFMGQEIFCVYLPLEAEEETTAETPGRKRLFAKRQTKSTTGKRIRPLRRFLHFLYLRKIQNSLWDALLTCQNISCYPAFCSKAVMHAFSEEKMLGSELWLSDELPPVLAELALARFLEKECVFRKQTQVFVIVNEEIPVGELLYPYCDGINYLQLMTENRLPYEDYAHRVYAKSGLAIAFTTQIVHVADADIVIDLSREQILTADMLRSGCLYFAGFEHETLEEEIRKRRDVYYFSTMRYWMGGLS
ncbi:MAG: hypothetical protein J6P60_06820 [Lachnospiraceae bacterium]|nr:hypothetical protein [Lachnospiraceae bacterium]